MIFFGRRGGPARTVLAIIGVGVLGLLSFVVFNLNTRLDNQQKANEATLVASNDIVDVNDLLTMRLEELVALTKTAQKALGETSALGPLLVSLREAIGPAATTVEAATGGAELSTKKLDTMHEILSAIKKKILPLVESADAFGGQGGDLLVIVKDLVKDLESAVAAAVKINQSLPLPD
ncbi:hypothetical protein [Nocardioides sp. WS12]|uniref:hypothetical protein n=1 Tax=Nocardioides sp. WS12 TaxID=2486272 RepID=UPI0015FBFEDF|nr:hypothetical protein [Nocardioides sp. WS12]